jgi:hypothetical protein
VLQALVCSTIRSGNARLAVIGVIEDAWHHLRASLERKAALCMCDAHGDDGNPRSLKRRR